MAEQGIFRGYKPLPAALAMLFLAFLLISLAARFWAGEKGYRFSGPTHIAAGAGQVWVFAAGNLFRLSPEGELAGVYASAETGLDTDPIDLKVLSGGRLLVAEQGPARIRVCDPKSWDCEPILEVALSGIKRQFKIVPGRQPGSWLLTDAAGDSLWEVQETGIELQAKLPAGTLAGPNDLVFDRAGGLWVADTDHKRLVELVADDNGDYITSREHSAVNEITVGQRWFPMMFDLSADQRLWVAQAADFSKPWSDLVVYDLEEGAVERILLPEGAYPTDVAVLGNQVLVTDLEQFAIYRIDSATSSVGRFGDRAFGLELRNIQQSRLEYDRLGAMALASLLVSAILMILFAVKATPKGKRLTMPPPAFDPDRLSAEVPQTTRVHWLERNPKIGRNMKWGERIFHGSLIVLIVCILIVYAWLNFHAGTEPGQAEKIDELGIILLLGVVMLAMLVPVVRLSVRVISRELGTDGKRLYIRLEDGRELAVDPDQLLYTNRVILYRRYMLPLLGGKGQALYQPGELDTWLAPLLRNARKVSQLDAVRHQWKHQESLLIWSILAAVAAASLLLAVFMMEA